MIELELATNMQIAEELDKRPIDFMLFIQGETKADLKLKPWFFSSVPPAKMVQWIEETLLPGLKKRCE